MMPADLLVGRGMRTVWRIVPVPIVAARRLVREAACRLAGRPLDAGRLLQCRSNVPPEMSAARGPSPKRPAPEPAPANAFHAVIGVAQPLSSVFRPLY